MLQLFKKPISSSFSDKGISFLVQRMRRIHVALVRRVARRIYRLEKKNKKLFSQFKAQLSCTYYLPFQPKTPKKCLNHHLVSAIIRSFPFIFFRLYIYQYLLNSCASEHLIDNMPTTWRYLTSNMDNTKCR